MRGASIPSRFVATSVAGLSAVGVAVTVECFALRLLEGDVVARHVAGPLGSSPDDTAAALIGLVGDPLDGRAVLHSTSWRWDGAAGLVLTYLCCPDPCDEQIAAVVRPAHSHRDDVDNPSRPGQGDFQVSDVLHHGIDHFAWLAEHRPASTAIGERSASELWGLIRRHGHHRAGQFEPAHSACPLAGAVGHTTAHRVGGDADE